MSTDSLFTGVHELDGAKLRVLCTDQQEKVDDGAQERYSTKMAALRQSAIHPKLSRVHTPLVGNANC